MAAGHASAYAKNPEPLAPGRPLGGGDLRLVLGSKLKFGARYLGSDSAQAGPHRGVRATRGSALPSALETLARLPGSGGLCGQRRVPPAFRARASGNTTRFRHRYLRRFDRPDRFLVCAASDQEDPEPRSGLGADSPNRLRTSAVRAAPAIRVRLCTRSSASAASCW